MATSLTLLVGCATQQQGAQNGNAKWVRWEKSAGGNGHYYKAVAVTNGITWTKAEKLARAEGGYLACITSKEENDFVFKLVNSPEFFIGAGGNGPALGGFRLDGAPKADACWCWESGEPWDFANWFPGDPNNWAGAEDRLMFWHANSSTPAPTWADIGRGVSIGGYVIERNH